jgi:Cu2+-exporting ATPase
MTDRRSTSATPSTPTTAPASCAHCGQAVPAGLVEPGAEQQFCCGGCRAVYATIHSCGLDDYYRLLKTADAVRAPAAPVNSRFESFDSATFHDLFVRKLDERLRRCELVLEGITCVACVWLIEKLPSVLPGVIEARLSMRDSSVTVTWDGSLLTLSTIARTLDRFGYRPHPPRGAGRTEMLRQEERRRLVHLGASFALMGNIMLLALALYAGMFGGIEEQFRTFFRWISLLLGSVALAWPGGQFFRSAWTSLRLRAPNLDVPISLALLAGWIAGAVNVVLNRGEIYFDSLSVLVFLLLVGRYLQFRQQRRVDQSVELLFALTPRTCRIVRGEQVLEQPTEALVPGDLLEVPAGALFSGDGVIESGNSSVDQALLTGESHPVPVGVGDRVCAGAQNLSATLRVRVEQVGEQTRVGQLMRLVEQGIREKPPIVLFADRVGRWFVVLVSLAAAITFAAWTPFGLPDAIDHAVALLIVTCPCVLGLATPLTLAVAIGRLARLGILVKSGSAMEVLAGRGRVLLDKTGTLTRGRMRVVEWVGPTDLQPLVAEIERRVSHPIASALVEEYGATEMSADLRQQVSRVESDPAGGVVATVAGETVLIGSPSFVRSRGAGISEALVEFCEQAESEGLTAVVVVRQGVPVAAISVGDELRDDSRRSVAALRELGWRPGIVSGDAPGVVRQAALAVGIEPDEALGGVTPEQKLEHVRGATARGKVLMVGDGVNDAAALAAADVGIAVHGGAEASLSAADVYISTPGTGPIVTLVHSARHTLRVIRRNLIISASYNLLAGALAAAGLMSPLLAAIIMPVSSATVLTLAVGSIARATRSLSWK